MREGSSPISMIPTNLPREPGYILAKLLNTIAKWPREFYLKL